MAAKVTGPAAWRSAKSNMAITAKRPLVVNFIANPFLIMNKRMKKLG
jgi:hypothetical protein